MQSIGAAQIGNKANQRWYRTVQENCSQERRALVIWQQIIREKEIAIARAR